MVTKTTALALRPSELPNIAAAALPAAYEAACNAMATCSNIDECKDWADKAAALASYAKQADDETLHDFATRIRARAVKRCGQLLEDFQAHPGPGRPKGNGTGTDTISQRQAAVDAGLSKRQEVTARAVANVPDDEFEAAVERDHPATVTELAERGTKSRPVEPVPEGFAATTRLLGYLKTISEFCEANDPDIIANAMYPHEFVSACDAVARIAAWTNALTVAIQRRERKGRTQ